MPPRRARHTLLTLAMALWATTNSHAQQVQNITATNWMATSHVLNRENYQKWAQDVAKASGERMKIEVHSSGSLVPARTTMQGVRDGVAAVGIVYPPYTPSEFPLNNVLNDLVFVSDDDMAAAFAYTELNLKNAALQAEWRKNGGLFLGGYSTPVYNLLCSRKTIRDVNDAQGLKIRTAGGAQNAWIKALGAIPVSVPSSDIYTGLERGSIDCTMSDPSNLGTSYRFWEVAKTVTRLPMGVVVGANYVFNTKDWKSYSDEQRRILIDTIAWGIARSQVGYHNEVEIALKGARERGLEMVEPSAALNEKLAQFKRDLAKNLPQQAMQERKVADPTALIQDYLSAEQKWKQLLQSIDRSSAEAVHKVLSDNLYQQIDPANYGL